MGLGVGVGPGVGGTVGCGVGVSLIDEVATAAPAATTPAPTIASPPGNPPTEKPAGRVGNTASGGPGAKAAARRLQSPTGPDDERRVLLRARRRRGLPRAFDVVVDALVEDLACRSGEDPRPAGHRGLHLDVVPVRAPLHLEVDASTSQLRRRLETRGELGVLSHHEAIDGIVRDGRGRGGVGSLGSAVGRREQEYASENPCGTEPPSHCARLPGKDAATHRLGLGQECEPFEADCLSHSRRRRMMRLGYRANDASSDALPLSSLRARLCSRSTSPGTGLVTPRAPRRSCALCA